MRNYYFCSIFIILLFIVSLFAVSASQAQARTLIWNEPTTKHNGIPLFWRFFNGSVTYYNLRYTSPEDIDISGADLIIAYTYPGDAGVAQIDKHGVPVAYFGRYFWFAPTFARAWQLALFFSHPNNIYKNIRFYRHYSSYWGLGLFKPARNIVVLHRAPRCNLLPWWKRWWYPCAPAKPFKYFFEMYDWPGRSGVTAKNIKIRYSASISNADTGETINNGEAIPTGTRIKFSFGEHKDSQISWTGAKHWRYLLSYLRIRYGWGYWGWWIWNERTFWNLYPRNNNGIWVDEGELPDAACRDEDFIFASRVRRFNRYLLGNILNYVTMSAERPRHSITGIENLQCEVDGDDTICTVNEAGNLNFNFVFEESNLRAYHSYKRIKYNWGPWEGLNTCLGVNNPMYKRKSSYSVSVNCADQNRCWADSHREYKKYRLVYVGNLGPDTESSYTPYYFEQFSVTIPEQRISYSISVVDSNSSPEAPSITGTENVLTGDTATFEITATDSDDDTIRYGIDWNDDEEVDQWLPDDGYTISGTTLSAAHSWTESGEKEFKVLAQDANDAKSDWKEFTINVLEEPTLEFKAEEYLIPKNTSTLLKWSAENANSCSATGAWDGTKGSEGSERTETLTEFQNEYTLQCENVLASTTKTISVYTYACGDNVCTTGVETCSSCKADCGECGTGQTGEWDVFLDLTEDPPQVRYGGGDDEVGN